jgi:transcriptional antiterminator NusG
MEDDRIVLTDLETIDVGVIEEETEAPLTAAEDAVASPPEESPSEAPSDETPSEEGPPPPPEEVARRLFASYLEPPEDKPEPEEGEEIEEPDLDAEISELAVTDGAELKLLVGEEDELEAGEEAEPGGRNWFVIHSYSGYENKVRKNLQHRIESLGMQNKIFEVVVPTEEEIELKDGQRRTVERRIFPGYILVDMIMDEDSWYVVRNTPGVTGFVGSVRRPTPLRKRDVDRILKRMRAETPRVKVSFQPGQKVRICDGPFEDFVGAVDDVYPDKGKVRILVSFFGRETPVELDFLQVEKI